MNTSASVSGTVEPGFEPVRHAFASVVDRQPGTGAAFAAWHDGNWVVDLWGGAADVARTRPWQPDSMVMPYSVTKPFAAVCPLVLADRGLLDPGSPVQRYWPEFRAPADVRQVLSHQAGVVVLPDPADTDLFYDWDAMCSSLAAEDPLWRPGAAIGESALFCGHLVGELVRRVDGRSLGGFLRDEVARPLGVEFAVGLDDADLLRAVDLTGLDSRSGAAGASGRPALYAQATSNPPGAFDADVVNSADWRSAVIPAINGHGAARGVAGLYAALLEGRLLSPEMLRDAVSAHGRGQDAVMGGERAWGLGFSVDEDGFGMGGTGGSVGWASVRGRYALGLVTGSIGDHQRADDLENSLRGRLGLPRL